LAKQVGAYEIPELKETFVKVVNVTQGILKTLVIPGVKKSLNPIDG